MRLVIHRLFYKIKCQTHCAVRRKVSLHLFFICKLFICKRGLLSSPAYPKKNLNTSGACYRHKVIGTCLYRRNYLVFYQLFCENSICLRIVRFSEKFVGFSIEDKEEN